MCLGQCIGVVRIAQNTDRLPGATHFSAPASSVDVDLAQCTVDLARGDAECLHPIGSQDDPDFAIDATKAVNLGHPVNRQQALGDRVVDEPAELLDGHVVSLDRKKCDWATYGIDFRHLRFEDAFRQRPADLINRIFHFVDAVIYVRANFKFDECAAAALACGRTDILDATDRSNRGLHPLGNLAFNLGRCCARL